jgi:hypothetical protein
LAGTKRRLPGNGFRQPGAVFQSVYNEAWLSGTYPQSENLWPNNADSKAYQDQFTAAAGDLHVAAFV